MIVIFAGIEFTSTFVALSPSAPTNVSGVKVIDVGVVVAASVLNIMIAAVPEPVIGVVVFAAPTDIDAVPDSIVPETSIRGNFMPFVIEIASSFVGSKASWISEATT